MPNANDFDLHLWILAQSLASGGEKNVTYFARRWGCSPGLVSRLRSGEKRISLDLAPLVFLDLPISMDVYYGVVFPRMHAELLKRLETLKGWKSKGFDPCRQCGDSLEEHEGPNFDTYTAGPGPRTGCKGYERWIKRGRKPSRNGSK